MSSTALAPLKQVGSWVQTSPAQPLKASPLNLTPSKPSSSSQKASTPQSSQESGRWVHPRMDEVARRRSATNFDNGNVRTIMINTAFILATACAPRLLNGFIPSSWSAAIQQYTSWAVSLLCLGFIINISLALAPLFRKQDACEDVPLTPSQRKLLGLPPMSRPATPLEEQQYVTPPRFSRSGTPQSSTSSLRAEAGGSPLSGRGTPMDSSRRVSYSGSPFGSTSDTERRRLSYTSTRSSPLSISEFEAAGNISTPTKNTKASVGLNNKWLYEKGRGSPRGSPVGSNRSSVFS